MSLARATDKKPKGFTALDLSGRKYNNWTVIKRVESSNTHAKWLCRCVCGKTKAVYASHLKSGQSKSCSSHCGKLPKTTPGYSSWQAMKERCYRPQHPAFHRYGGRGISVCNRWLESFENFIADMGQRPAGLTLERLNTDGNYEPTNCKWASPQEQQNNLSTNIRVVIHGEEMTLAEYARRSKIAYQTVYSRFKRGAPLMGGAQ